MKNFNKEIFDPMERVHLRGDMNPEIKDLVWKHFIPIMQEELNDAENKSASIEKELGEDVVEKINKVYDWVKDEFANRGIDEVKPVKAFLMPEHPSTVGKFGNHDITHVAIYNTDIDDKKTKQFLFLEILSHELYHSTGKLNHNVTISNNNIHVNSREFGLAYAPNDEKKECPWALEEGMAILFADKISKKIKTLFPPETMEKYNNLLASFEYPKSEGVEPMILLSEWKASGNFGYYANEEYGYSKKLTEYVASQIPDFEKIVEQARVAKKPLELVRAIEKRFGEGSFRRLTTTTVEEAKDVLEELKEKGITKS